MTIVKTMLAAVPTAAALSLALAGPALGKSLPDRVADKLAAQTRTNLARAGHGDDRVAVTTRCRWRGQRYSCSYRVRITWTEPVSVADMPKKFPDVDFYAPSLRKTLRNARPVPECLTATGHVTGRAGRRVTIDDQWVARVREC